MIVMAEKKKQRILWIDYIKGFCMLLVVMSHSAWPEGYDILFSPIFLTGFFFVSGYTYNDKLCFRDFLLARFRTLVIPIILLGVINAILANIADGKPIWERLCGLILQRAGQWDDLWFVSCLFTVEVIYYMLSSLTHKPILRLILSFIVSICGYIYMSICHDTPLPWHIDNACVLLPFFCVGEVIRKYSRLNLILEYIKSEKGYATIFAIWMLYVLTVIVGDNVSVNIHLREYGKYPIFMLNALIGVVALFVSAVGLERFSMGVIPKSLTYIGQNTLVYYAFQFKAIRLVQIIFSAIGLSIASYIGNILGCILVCLILIFPAYIIKRYFPWILGRWYKRC